MNTKKLSNIARTYPIGFSMLLDTLGCLFEGLYIYDKWDWQAKSPSRRGVFKRSTADSGV
ncbi:hypothetical protein ACTXPD_07620 [Vreelandella alkaliphila]|uniref:hypothetical protein n=1 Tax=Halomonadaceae TaxID=28256 RepID=UPI000B5B3326|nr:MULTISPECIES: hypothetical protein [unclassified Halomonas]ASK21324.1 hypothetical protein CEK60_19350 [Halomonas sp. N3-2A]UTD56716.1 hypothetical protein NF683_05685 [Halomonas sp. MS1]